MLQTPRKEPRSPDPGFIHNQRPPLPLLEAGTGAVIPSPLRDGSPAVAVVSALVDMASLLSRGLTFTCGNERTHEQIEASYSVQDTAPVLLRI